MAAVETAPDSYLAAWVILEQQLRMQMKLDWQRTAPVVLALYSEKGGVGKTGATTGLAAVAASNGLKVLVIDLDPRATATEELGAVEGEFSVNDLLYVDPHADLDALPELSGLAARALRPAGEDWGPNIKVLAAERALQNRESDNTTPDLENRLRVALEGVADQFDLVLIDMPPRPGGKIVGAGLRAATDVLYLGTLTNDGFIGIQDAKRTVRIMNQTGSRKLNEIGVVRNIVGRKIDNAVNWDGQFSQAFGDKVLPVVVPYRAVREESRTACVPITAASGKAANVVIRGYLAVLNFIGKAA